MTPKHSLGCGGKGAVAECGMPATNECDIVSRTAGTTSCVEQPIGVMVASDVGSASSCGVRGAAVAIISIVVCCDINRSAGGCVVGAVIASCDGAGCGIGVAVVCCGINRAAGGCVVGAVVASCDVGAGCGIGVAVVCCDINRSAGGCVVGAVIASCDVGADRGIGGTTTFNVG